MDYERILVFGDAPEEFRSASITDSPNLYEYAVAIWDINFYPKDLKRKNFTFTRHSMNYDSAKYLESLLKKFTSKIYSWVSEGHTAILLVSEPLSFGYNLGNTTYSFSLSQTKLFDGISFDSSRGSLMELCGPPALVSHLSGMLSDLHYQAILQAGDIIPLFKVSVGRQQRLQIVGGYKSAGKGFIFYVPILKTPSDDPGFQFDQSRYFVLLSELPELLAQPAAPLPDWIDQFVTVDEAAAIEDIDSTRTQISNLNDNLAALQDSMAGLRITKTLFSGTGDDLVQTAHKAFEAFGLKVVPGPHPRADLLAYDGQNIFVIEVKGVEGPVRELYLRETEQWVSDVRRTLAASPEERTADVDLSRYADALSNLGVDLQGEAVPTCVGILVVSTFRKIALSERHQSDFPDSVTRTIERSDVCALTGLQLYGLLDRFRRSQIDAIDIVKLFKTPGILQSDAWQEFLSIR